MIPQTQSTIGDTVSTNCRINAAYKITLREHSNGTICNFLLVRDDHSEVLFQVGGEIAVRKDIFLRTFSLNVDDILSALLIFEPCCDVCRSACNVGNAAGRQGSHDDHKRLCKNQWEIIS